MSTPQGTHLHKVTLVEEEFVPDHPGPRRESKLFERTKHHLVAVLKTPCWICGTHDNLEVHHFHCEWSMADSQDWSEQPWVEDHGDGWVIHHQTGKMREVHPDFNWSTFTKPEDFVDSEYNMMVLCATHHRHKDHGIHAMTYPAWIAQRGIKHDYILTPDEENGNQPAGN